MIRRPTAGATGRGSSPTRRDAKYVLQRERLDGIYSGSPYEGHEFQELDELLESVQPLTEPAWEHIGALARELWFTLPIEIARWAQLARCAAALFKEPYNRDADETDLANNFLALIKPVRSHPFCSSGRGSLAAPPPAQSTISFPQLGCGLS